MCASYYVEEFHVRELSCGGVSCARAIMWRSSCARAIMWRSFMLVSYHVGEFHVRELSCGGVSCA